MSTGHGSDLPDWSGRGGRDPYVSGHDPYSGHGPYGQSGLAHPDPYASDPLEADGFGPVFGSSIEHGAPVHGAPRPYGAAPAGPAGHLPYQPGPPTSSSAITSLVLGILALTMCAGLTAPVGVVFGAIGLKATGPEATEPRGGRGLAIAGLVTSLVGLLPFLLMVLYLVLIIVGVAAELSAV